jgi:colanic acid biosynthesis glycosyl transferase WcaI
MMQVKNVKKLNSGKRFIIVSCVFPPEPVVSAQTSAQLAQELVTQGHKVTVVTSFPNRPGGRVYSGYKRRLFKKEITAHGCEIIRCFSTLSPNSSITSRFLENITFGITSGIFVLFTRRPNVIYSNTWPIFATGLLSLVAILRRIPIVVSIQDIYPESLIIQRRLSQKSWSARILSWVDGIIARKSHAIVVISSGFAKVYRTERKVPESSIHIVPNWMDIEHVNLDADGLAIRHKYNVPERSLLLVYAGNVGTAAGIETVIEAFQNLIDFPNVHLLIAGEGSRLERCKKLAEQVGNGKVIFHSPWRMEETSAILQAGDVLVLPTYGSQSLVSVPSKLISYLLARKPVLALALPGSDINNTILEANCGWVIKPDLPSEVVEKIKEISRLRPEQLEAKGIAGREYAICNLSKNVNLHRIVQVLKQAGQ